MPWGGWRGPRRGVDTVVVRIRPPDAVRRGGEPVGRAVAAIASGVPRSMGRSVERSSLEGRPEVPQVHRAAEDRAGPAALEGNHTIAELAREREISETLLRRWREQFLAGGAEKLAGKTERSELAELRRENARLARTLGKKTMALEISGELLRGWE